MIPSPRTHSWVSEWVFSFALFWSSLALGMEWSQAREALLSLYLGSDRLPGAGFSGLHLRRMVVDLPELQD